MTKAYRLYLQKFKIAQIVCMLFIALSVFALTGCTEETTSNQGPGQAANHEEAMRGCLVCPLFKITYEAINKVAQTTVPAVAKGVLPVMAVGYGLVLALFIMKYIGSLVNPDVGAFWKGLAEQTFWAGLGAALLVAMGNNSSDSLLYMFADAVFSGFVDAGLTIIQATGIDVGGCAPSGDAETGLLCLIKALQEKLTVSPGIALLAIFLCPGPALIMGIFILITSLMLMVYLPVQLLDGVFRYGIAMCMLPLATAAYVFKPLRDFTKKVVKMFLEIGIAVVTMCVFAAACVQILKDYIDQYLPFFSDPLSLVTDLKALERAIFGPGMIGLIFLCFFLMCFAEVILDFAGALSNGAGGLGKGVSNVKNSAKAVTNAGRTIGRFGKNRLDRRAAKRDKALLDEAHKAGGADKVAERIEKTQGSQAAEKYKARMELAQDRMSDRGFIAKGPDGKMHKTKAYEELGNKSGSLFKRAVRSSRAFLQDIGKGGGEQDKARRKHYLDEGEDPKTTEYNALKDTLDI